MKSKAPLALMEQIIMVLVFALAAALCLRTFALSDRMSREGELRDGAVLLAHPVHAMAFAVTDTEFDPRTIPESYILLRDVKRISYEEYCSGKRKVRTS